MEARRRDIGEVLKTGVIGIGWRKSAKDDASFARKRGPYWEHTVESCDMIDIRKVTPGESFRG